MHFGAKIPRTAAIRLPCHQECTPYSLRAARLDPQEHNTPTLPPVQILGAIWPAPHSEVTPASRFSCRQTDAQLCTLTAAEHLVAANSQGSCEFRFTRGLTRRSSVTSLWADSQSTSHSHVPVPHHVLGVSPLDPIAQGSYTGGKPSGLGPTGWLPPRCSEFHLGKLGSGCLFCSVYFTSGGAQ
jgi:hypothetical protein